MKKINILLLLLSAFGFGLKAQKVGTDSIRKLFDEQLSVYPQEKIYVQTDRNTYLSGETLWLRAHLVDAIFHKQANASRYVYAELIDPFGGVVERIKLRPDSLGGFPGHLRLGEGLPEGNYTLRAYTKYMRNQGEAYFFRKAVYVLDPLSEKITPSLRFYRSNDKGEMDIDLSAFSTKDSVPVSPGLCSISLGDGNFRDGEADPKKNGVVHWKWKDSQLAGKKSFLLRMTYEGRQYSCYFAIPSMDKAFHVSFFPEGGQAPVSADVMMAFKSINADGLSEEVTGQVYDDQDVALTSFESLHLGMGSFRMYYSPGRKYYAVCTNKQNVSQRFDLPLPADSTVALKAMWSNDGLRVSLSQSPNFQPSPQLQLVAQIRGAVLYAEPWDVQRNYVLFEKDFFPDGIIHFMLVDTDGNILSERLVFSSQNSSVAVTEVAAEKSTYKPREKIELAIKLTDRNKVPVAGNVSLAVVDKTDVSIDTCSTIVSTLLLASELKGYIESPMSYLQKDSKRAALALDALMMTQGWRRYDLPAMMKGEITRKIQYPVELSEVVSGKADGVFTSLKNGNISLLAVRDSLIGTSYTKADQKGNFSFTGLEYPDSTKYIIQALAAKGSRRAFIEVDTLRNYPPETLRLIFPSLKKTELQAPYLAKLNKRYTMENGIRVVNLSDVEIVGKRRYKQPTSSPFYSISSSSVVTADDIEKWKLQSVYDLLRRIPGVRVMGTEVSYRGNPPMLLLDNVPRDDFDYDLLMVDDIQEAFVTPGTSMGALFGSRGSNGAIVINTKKGFVQTNKINANISVMKAAGYQQAVSFYSPVYETDEQKNNGKSDLRSTIYWNPDIHVGDDGMARVSFYAADTPSIYGVVLEGVSQYGHLVYSSGKEIQVVGGR
ncbi:MAG: TonB-dependent receptor, partial [Bacteroidales bacterium 45-6]